MKREKKIGKSTLEGKLAKKSVDIIRSDKYMMQDKSTSEFDGKIHEMVTFFIV